MQLRDWLEREGLTQEALGRRMTPPVSKGKVSHWLNGTRRVNLGEAIQLRQLTNHEVGFDELWAMYSGAPDAQPEAVHAVTARANTAVAGNV